MKKVLPIILTIIILTTFAFAIDISGANAPEVYQGLYPIKYAANGDVMFTSASDPDWFNYANGKWANAVTLDKLGQMDPSTATEANITGYYVWIPRYAYLIRTGYNSSKTGRIDIRFLIDNTNTDKDGNTYLSLNTVEETNNWEEVKQITYVGDRQMAYLVHPAFDFEEELTGIWVGKNEMNISKADVNRDGKIDDNDSATISNLMSSLGYSKTADLDNDGTVKLFDYTEWASIVGTGRHTSIDEAFEKTRDMISKSENYDKYNLYGLPENTNTHLIKPTEYGAVVYLANSKYKPTELYKVHGIDSRKEYLAGGLAGTQGIVMDKYVDRYTKDEEGNIVDIKGSAYLETSDGTTAWNNETTVGNSLDYSVGVIVKENQYGSIGNNGESTAGVGFRAVITKGSNKNEVKDFIKLSHSIYNSSERKYYYYYSYYWLMQNGDVWVMGDNTYGQLGLGDTNNREVVEKLRKDSEGNSIPAIKEIKISNASVYCLAENGEVYVAGRNNYGQLGIDNEDEKICKATKVGLGEEKIKEIVIQGSSTYYITQSGDVYATGSNSSGKLGVNSTSSNIYKVTKVDLGGNKIKEIVIRSGTQYPSIYFVTQGGDIYATGGNHWGELGINDTTNTEVYKATKVDLGEDKIKEIVIQGNSIYYITQGGNVYATGKNDYGQLGVNDTSTKIYKATKVDLGGDTIKKYLV